jgi:hypothetical protein
MLAADDHGGASMTDQSTTTMRHRSAESEIEREIDHVRDLVTLRDRLAERGATAAELDEYRRTVDVARSRLAEMVRRASAPSQAAA